MIGALTALTGISAAPAALTKPNAVIAAATTSILFI
jgi:hypothetical protein